MPVSNNALLLLAAALFPGAHQRCHAIPPNLFGRRHFSFDGVGQGRKHHAGRRSKRGLQSDGIESPTEQELPQATKQKNNKALKICNVLGGLDITRLRSSDTRSLFREALEDVELVREYLSDAALNGARANLDVLSELSKTLDYKARNDGFGTNYTELDTTVTAGLSWVDDRPDRRIDRFVSEANMPFVGDKSSDAAMIDAAADILPWIADRRSKESSWHVPHHEGHVMTREPFKFDKLYQAAYVVSWGESLWYYPPFHVYGHPLTLADVQGANFSTQEMVWESYIQENPEPKKPFLFGPYADAMDPNGVAMVSALALFYYDKTFQGNNYTGNDFIAQCGVDILLSSVSDWLKDLEGTLAPGSFALLVDSTSFKAVTISQSVVEMIFPERTGSEDQRLVDIQGKPVGVDRRNQTYLVGDTIHQPLTSLKNADWPALQQSILNTTKGDRGYDVLHITLTGTSEAVPHYVMFDRWAHVADWTLLVAVPKTEMDDAINVALSSDSVNMEVVLQSNINDNKESTGGTFIIENRGSLDVNILPHLMVNWIEFVGDAALIVEAGGNSLVAGSSAEIDYIIRVDRMQAGTSSSIVSIRVTDDGYPDCFHDSDLSFSVTVKVASETEYNHIGNLAAAGLTLMAIVLVVSLFFAVWTFKKRQSGVVRASQPLFLGLICVGVFVMALAIIPLSFDDGNASQAGADIACMAVPWLASMGFTISFAALFSKIWRINQIFKGSRAFKKVVVTEWDVLKPFGVLFGLNFVLLLAWSLVDPLRFVRVPVTGSNDQETYGLCQSENNGSKSFGIPVAIVNIGALVLACIQAYQARSISDEYSESKYLAIAVGSWFELVVVGLPLVFLLENNPTASYFLKSAMIFAFCMSLLLLIFVPKFFSIRRKKLEKERKNTNTSISSTANRFGLNISGDGSRLTNPHQSSSAQSNEPNIGNDGKPQHKASVGLQIIALSTFTPEDLQNQAMSEDYTRLKEELAQCKEKIRKFEEESDENLSVPISGGLAGA